MPIYEYACDACDHRLDALQKMADAPLADCPSCGEPSLQRLLSAPRFRLKGQGWYETDFKTDKQRNIAGDKEPAKADGGKSEAGKPEAGKSEPGKTESKAPAAETRKVDTKKVDAKDSA
ncbi:MAG: zinc ribbon domain-containing protein [Proteobacteria bacterium]|nr:zinc ribbon domain-containing protein [Pseudomonadota bacterium]